MYDHPEGEVHPKAPSHIKRFKNYHFGEEIFVVRDNFGVKRSLGTFYQ